MGHIEPGSKHVCKCEKCGNEAEMVITCTLEPSDQEMKDKQAENKNTEKVKATCSTCGNEADMWIDYE